MNRKQKERLMEKIEYDIKSDMIAQEENKIKQTLIEIKEIAEWHTTSADSEDVQEDMKQILQKISECEVV